VSFPCGACGHPATEHFATARDVEYFTSDDVFNYVRCERCGSLSLEHPPVGKLAEIYPPNYYSFQPVEKSLALSIKDALDKRLFRWCLVKLPKRPIAVLDVGGGVGYQLNLIRDLDSRVEATTVVDLDPEAETVAKKQGHEYFHGRIEDYRPTRAYDFILALNLIEHVANPSDVLLKIRDCLTPEGMVLIKTPNIDSLDARLFRHRNWGGFHCPRHWVLFDKSSFLSIAERAGLRPIRFKFTQGAPFWAVSILAALQARGIINLGTSRPAYRHPLYKVLIALFGGFDLLRSPFAAPSQMFCILRRR
jgi:2-polyprenyl-3-methyl-5-hydroxy-6-metoxy-1,4-benzoquinol methylase